MSLVEILLGKSWGQRVVIIFAVTLYLYLSFRRPSVAWKSFTDTGKMFVSFLTLIFAAMMIAKAVENMIRPEAVTGLLGEAAGLRGVFLGGFLGSILPGGPYATYPIVNSLYTEGASLAAVVSMVIGWSILGLSKIPYGLSMLNPKIVGLRYLIGAPALLIVCAIAYLLL